MRAPTLKDILADEAQMRRRDKLLADEHRAGLLNNAAPATASKAAAKTMKVFRPAKTMKAMKNTVTKRDALKVIAPAKAMKVTK